MAWDDVAAPSQGTSNREACHRSDVTHRPQN
jgi:hypothetical protein